MKPARGTWSIADHAIGHEGITRPDRGGLSTNSRGGAVALPQTLGFGGIRGQKHVAAAVELERLSAFAVERFEQIDTAVHEAHHRVVWAGPEVAITLRAHAARERQRLSRIDEHHASDAASNGELVGSGHAGNPGTRDDNLGDSRRGHLHSLIRIHLHPLTRPRLTDEHVDRLTSGAHA